VWAVCRVSPDSAVARFRRRGPDPEKPDLTEEIVRRSAKAYVYPERALELDTDAITPEECVRAACRLFE
jgi:hypothetical protein